MTLINICTSIQMNTDGQSGL